MNINWLFTHLDLGMNLRAKRGTLAITLGVLLSACVVDIRPGAQTDIPPDKREWFGEFYNLEEYRKCREKVLATNVACDYLRLTREEEPEYWPYPNISKPKLPEPSDPPVYRLGMSGEEYFKALCEKEAGEFIYKTVENVEGVYQIRPRKRASSDALYDRYVMEDPYGYTDWESEESGTLFVDPPFRNYKFVEFRDRNNALGDQYLHLSGYVQKKKTMEIRRSATVSSRYGFTWRGIKRPRDRELGIAGGELIVLDLTTNEVLAIRRGFSFSTRGPSRSNINWESSSVCPRLRTSPDGFDKWPSFTYGFLSKVLRPAAYSKLTMNMENENAK